MILMCCTGDWQRMRDKERKRKTQIGFRSGRNESERMWKIERDKESANKDI